MSEFIVKKKKKLDRVEIISSDKAQNIRDLIYNPFVFDDDNLAIEDFEPVEEDLTPPEPVEIKQTYFNEFRFTNLRKPQEIDLRRVPPIAILKELHDIEMEQSYKDGYDACYNELKTKFDAEKSQLEEWLRNFDLVTDELNNQFSLDLKKFEDTLLSLSIMVAQHILDREVSSHSSTVIEQVRKAINAVEEDKIFKIKINPINVKVLEDAKSSLFEDKSKLAGISIIADESVDLGGCILETSAGMVDGRIKTQLGLIADQIFNSGIEDLFEEEEIVEDNYEIPEEITELEEEYSEEVFGQDTNEIQDDSDVTSVLNDSTELSDELENSDFEFDGEIDLQNLEFTEKEFENSDISLDEEDFLKDLQNFDLGESND